MSSRWLTLIRGECHFIKDDVSSTLNKILNNYDFNECHCIYTEKSPLYIPFMLVDDRIKFTSFDNYGADIKDVLTDNSQNILIIMGISRMIGPGNRCDMRFEYMYNFAKYKNKFVVDDVPYLIDKWRIMYPYMVLSPTLIPFNHSYAAETAYNNYKEGRLREDPFDIDWLVSLIKDHTHIDYQKYFDFEIEFEVYEASESEKAGYETLKEELFQTKNSISGVLSGLNQYANSIYPNRNIFKDLNKLYKMRGPQIITMTDLKVDMWFKSEIERVISETNSLTGSLYNAQAIS